MHMRGMPVLQSGGQTNSKQSRPSPMHASAICQGRELGNVDPRLAHPARRCRHPLAPSAPAPHVTAAAPSPPPRHRAPQTAPRGSPAACVSARPCPKFRSRLAGLAPKPSQTLPQHCMLLQRYSPSRKKCMSPAVQEVCPGQVVVRYVAHDRRRACICRQTHE